MIDIVGTLNQPSIALVFIILGLLTGTICAIIKFLVKPSKKLTLVVGDFICTILFFIGFIALSFLKTHGVVFVYTLISTALGYVISYFLVKKFLSIIIKTFKKIFHLST